MTQEQTLIYKKKLVDTLAAFDKFCRENQLRYFICSGTAIGAIRHKGFIPWDDDIDVQMPREDYERMLAIRSKLNETHYRIKNLGDEEYIYSFAKFYDADTTMVEYQVWDKCVLGLYIDIFPLDEVSGTNEEIRIKRKLYLDLYHTFQRSYLKISMKYILSALVRGDFSLSMTYTKLKLSESYRHKVRKEFINFENEWKQEKGDRIFVHNATYALEKEIFRKYWFDEEVDVEFEGLKVPITKYYDEYLSQLFGDYMQLPPVEKRVSGHSHYYLNLVEGLSAEEVVERIKKGETEKFE